MQNKKAYIFDFILLIFIFILRFLLINKYSKIYEIVTILFFVIASFILYKLLGFRKSKSLISENATQIVIISLLLFILLTYLSGLYFGFLRNAYSLNIKSIISNTYMLAVVIISEELIRWMIAKSSKKDIKPLIILSILYVLLDVALEYNTSIQGIKLFVFITDSVLASLSRNALATYITYKISYIPSLIMNLFFGLYIYILPIFPDYGYYISSIIGIVFPYLVYLAINKLARYAEHVKTPVIRKKVWYFNIPLIVCLMFIIILVSGIFKYQIMAVGSGSMEPIIFKGDAIIFEKYNEKEKINIDDIIVFRQSGKYITHRVVEIKNYQDHVRYITKGDNNNNEDDYLTTNNEVVGVVKMKIKYLGLPTIWFQEAIS